MISQGGTLIFYIYIGLADFLGVKISIFVFFSEKSLFYWVVSFLWVFFGVCSLIDYFFWVISNFQVFLGGLSPGLSFLS